MSYNQRMTLNKVNYWPTYSLLGVLLVMVSGFAFFTYKHNEVMEAKEERAAAKIAAAAAEQKKQEISPENAWTLIYPDTKMMKIGEIQVKASVAQSWPDRIKGLSDTPYLPEDVVKLFIFDSAAQHSIWMKDMNYAIDIIWVDEEGKIVHLEEEASPESYPAMFVPKVPALYVIETVAGFVEKNSISLGQEVELPSL